MTYRELKQKLEQLTEDQLNQEVRSWSEYEPLKPIKSINITTEDYIYDMENMYEGCVLRSEIIAAVGEEDFNEEDYKVALKTGTVFLWIE